MQRKFTTEELHLLYTDVLTPYANRQYDIVYERLVEQFSFHQSFNRAILELFVSSVAHLRKQKQVIPMFQDIVQLNHSNNRSLVSLVLYGLSLLMYKSGEYIQSYQIAKFMLKKKLSDEIEACVNYVLAKIYLRYYYGQEQVFKCCMSRVYQSTVTKSYKLFNKFHEYYMVDVLLNQNAESLEYCKLNTHLAIQHLVKGKVIAQKYSKVKLDKLIKRLKLLESCSTDQLDDQLDGYERLQYYMYKMKQNTMEYEEDMLTQFDHLFLQLTHPDLNKLRTLGVYFALRGAQWETCVKYCAILLKYCPTIDEPTQFYHSMSSFHREYPLLFDVSDSFSTSNVEWKIADKYNGVANFDTQFLQAKMQYVTGNEHAVKKYQQVLSLIHTRDRSIYSTLLDSSDIRYECHSVIGELLLQQSDQKKLTQVIYHLYNALLLHTYNHYIWSRLWKALQKARVHVTDTVLYVKFLHVFVQFLKTEEAQENSELLEQLTNEIKRYNSKIQIVNLDQSVTLDSLRNEHLVHSLFTRYLKSHHHSRF